VPDESRAGGEASPFLDHFSRDSAAYAEFRPRYPEALLATLAGIAPSRELAWDCATGTGQAATALAAFMARVHATDASAAQIASAEAHARVSYAVAPAHASGLADASVDLVMVAQALHWFDLPAFYHEVRRVLRPRGVLAVWCYGLLSIDEAIDAVLRRFYVETVGPFWPPERVHVDRGYRDLPFPFEEIALPSFAMETTMSLPELLGYVSTWSAVAQYVRARHEDPLPALRAALAPPWGDAQRSRVVRWPLAVRAGRVASA
jgi:SAM-dependent methyltransferase